MKGPIFYLIVVILLLLIMLFVYNVIIFPPDYTIKNLNAKAISGNIPKRIFQIWVGPSSGMNKHKRHIQSVKSMNPDCEYMFFEESDIETFFKTLYPDYYSTYQSLPILIQKLDFFRYVAIYHYGGIYLDLDIVALKPLDESFFAHSCVFPIDEYLHPSMNRNPRYRPFFQEGCYFLLGQYGFAAEPRHPFLLNLIQNIHGKIKQIKTEYESNQPMRKRDREWFVYRTTGPDYVTECFMRYWNKSEIYILDNGKRQHLGNYARHEYFGSWK